MDIVIHATKNGHCTLYSTNKEIVSVIEKDVRIGSSDDRPIGQSVYALSFIAEGTVFTKYTIVKDTERSNGLGFIAFALFLSFNKTLRGEEIINLLDELSKNYSDKYIKDNYLNRGEKISIKQEYNFVDDILKKYREQDKSQKNEVLHSGTKDAVFVYYKDEAKLREYFDKPFQEEYRDFKQVYFINEVLKGDFKNPLNVLSNSGEELKDIDLKNEYYYLNNYYPNKGITIIADGKHLLDGKYNNYIRSKWQVEISYSKDDRCYYPIFEKGTLFDSNIQEYLEIKGNQISIKHESFIKPKSKTLTIKIKDIKGNDIENAEIRINNKQSEPIKGHQYELIIKGEDLKERWTISAQKGNSLFSKIDLIDFDKDTLELELYERRVLKIFANEEENPKNEITNFLVWVQGKVNNQRITEVVFEGDEINKDWNISVEIEGYQRSEIKSYYPASNLKQLTFDLKKPPKTISNTENKDNESNLDITTKDKGRKFYQNSKLIAVSLVMLLILGIGIFWGYNYFSENNSPETLLTSADIKNYVEGDELILDKLNEYQTDWNKQNPEDKGEESYLDILWPFGEKPTTKEKNNWKQTNNSIENAINKRKLIDEKKFKELANMNFSFEKQQQFSKSVKKIKKTKFQEVDEKLGNVANLTLSEIAGKIDSLLKVDNNVSSGTGGSNEASGTSSSTNQRTDRTDSISPTNPDNRNRSSNSNSNNPSPPPTSAAGNNVTKSEGINDKIINYLKSGEIKKSGLEEFKQQTNDAALKKSIDLALKFWELEGSRNNSYKTYLEKINKDSKLKNSVLQRFVTEMNKLENAKYINTIPGYTRKGLNELKSKLNENN